MVVNHNFKVEWILTKIHIFLNPSLMSRFLLSEAIISVPLFFLINTHPNNVRSIANGLVFLST